MKIFKKTNAAFATYYRKIFVIYVVLTLPLAILEQYIFQTASTQNDKTIYGVMGIILSFFETQMVLVLLGFGLQQLKNRNLVLREHFHSHLKDLIIETLRALGKIAMGFLLIVPGIKRAIQYYLIPYIVQFDSGYKTGDVDVLVQAEKLLKGRFAAFSLILLLTQFVGIGIQLLGMQYNLFTTPSYWFLIYFLEVTVTAYVFLFFYNYYVNLSEGF